MIPLRTFSTVSEIPAGANTLPTTPLAYSNLIGVKSWAARAEVSLVAGMKASLGQMPLYSKISGSTSCEEKVTVQIKCEHRTQKYIHLKHLVSGLHLQHEEVGSGSMDQDFAGDFESSPCQSFLWQATHKKCFIFVHVGLSKSKFWGWNKIEISLLVGIWFNL